MVNSFLKYVIYIVIGVIAVSIFYLTTSAKKTTNELQSSIEKSIEFSIKEYAKRFSLQIAKKIPNDKTELVDIFKKNRLFRDECSNKLELIRSKYIPYVYLLWLDKQGRFRFLCDGSADKSHFFQKFDPGNLSLWHKIYRKNIDEIISQKKYKGLWKTYLKPINIQGKTQALLVIDYSTALPSKTKQIIKPFKTFIIIILLSVFLLFIAVIFQILYTQFIKRKTYTDQLTGIYNRRFLDILAKKIVVSQYDIAMIDIDHFKRVNDIYGHLIGDKALKHIVNIINAHLSKKDYFIRFGGEEFILFLRKNRKKRDNFELVNKIHKNISNNPLKYEEYGSIDLTVSAGINLNTKLEKDFEIAIKNSDKALYDAKKAGRNCIIKTSLEQFYKEIKNYDFMYIKTLIDKEKIVCHYQPILSINNNKVTKYEVLARLEDEDGHIIYPDEFLSIIWKTNIYQRFTKQIIQNSIQKFKNRSERFSINLSLQDILDEKIFSIIEDIAKKEPLTISRMGIEILEYDRFDNVERLEEVIKKLKRFGISIILDDFGSGHSNYAIVEQLDIDELKIDGTIVEHVCTNTKSKYLLKSLALFAQDTDIKTVVEYVSSKEIYEEISKLPFTYLQGFYIGKPQERLVGAS